MAGVRFTELQSRPMEFLDCTSVTLDEFQQLVPPFETAFQCQMAARRDPKFPVGGVKQLRRYQNRGDLCTRIAEDTPATR